MYTPNRVAVYSYVTFAVPSGGLAAHVISVDVSAHGYPPEAVAVELFVGCRSWVDGAYVVAYDGLTGGIDRTALYVTAPVRNQWTFSRARVELDGSSFLMWVRPITEPVEVIAVLKGYYDAA